MPANVSDTTPKYNRKLKSIRRNPREHFSRELLKRKTPYLIK